MWPLRVKENTKMESNTADAGAKKRCLQAVALLQWMLPQPKSYPTQMGFFFRKKRLACEIAEFDFLLRMRRGRAATLDEMCCAGSILISSRSRGFPTVPVPLDESLIVNAQSFDLIAAWVDERMTAAAEMEQSNQSNSTEISTRRSQ